MVVSHYFDDTEVWKQTDLGEGSSNYCSSMRNRKLHFTYIFR